MCIEHTVTARVGRERKTLTHKSRKGIERLVSDFKTKNPSATFGAIRETLFEGYGWTKISWYFMGPPMEEQVWARGGTRTECEQNIERNIAKKQDEAKLKRLGESEERTIHTNRVAAEMDSWEEERKRQLGGITWATYGQEVIDAKLNSDPGYIGQYNNALGYIKNHMLLPTVAAERGKEVTPFVIGELLLGEMTQQHVQEWLDSVDRRKKPNGEPYSAQTKKLLRSFVRMVYYQAQAAGKPVKTILWDQRRGGIRITKPVHKVKALFSDELVRELFLACEDDQERALVALCLCSLRAPGEVVAVRWRNIRGGIIQVEKQHRDQNGKLFMTNTKTRTVRDVPIPPHLAKFIEAVRPKNAKGDAWVLQGGYRSKSGKKTDLDGSLSPGRAQDIFDKIIVRMKAAMAQKERPVYEEFSIYCCRKTALTALSRVTDPKTLMSIAGHTSVATTMQYYLESSRESKVEAMQKLAFGADIEIKR